jgi:hypothetical protein
MPDPCSLPGYLDPGEVVVGLYVNHKARPDRNKI